MIDTDIYEGHYTDDFARFWVTADDELNADIDRARATEYLIDDAPLLLAEFKRLREQLGRYTQFVLWVEEEHNEVFDEYEGKDEL
tara:strand:+ start:30 stop:284 length:255 start_codon:yes stop_codon:yes gene_type:complete